MFSFWEAGKCLFQSNESMDVLVLRRNGHVDMLTRAQANVGGEASPCPKSQCGIIDTGSHHGHMQGPVSYSSAITKHVPQ